MNDLSILLPFTADIATPTMVAANVARVLLVNMSRPVSRMRRGSFGSRSRAFGWKVSLPSGSRMFFVGKSDKLCRKPLVGHFVSGPGLSHVLTHRFGYKGST